MPSTLDLSEWQGFKQAMQDAGLLGGPQLAEVLTEATTQAVVELDRVVRRTLPPPVVKKQVSEFWTERQTRWWWATMRAKALGKSRALPGWDAHYEKDAEGRTVLVISGAYKRTGTLIKSLTYDKVKITEEDGVMKASVKYGTNRAYAKWVIDEENQSEYHKGNWQTLQGFLTVAREPILETFGKALTRELRKRML